MSISYHGQFREHQRSKNQNGLFSHSKATAGGKLPAQRPTVVVKQPQRSDTFTLPTKNDETNFKVPKVNQSSNGSRRQLSNKPAVIKSQPPAEQKPTKTMRRNGGNRPIDRQNLQRKPVRFSNNYNDNNNNTYHSSSPAYYRKPPPLADPLPRDNLDKSRRMRVASDDYVIQRRKDSPAYAYNDYQTVSNIPTTSYTTTLPPISQSVNQRAPTVIIHRRETPQSDPPTVIIHPKETLYPRPPTVIPTLSYPPSAPFMILPSSTAPMSNMIFPNSTVPSYPPTSTMIFPTTTAPTQPPVHTFLLQHPPNSTYLSQPFFYPMPFPNPKPNPPPVPPPPQQTIISQSSSSSVSAPTTTVKTENRTEENNNATIIVQPNSAYNRNKNVTIQLKMLDEDHPPAQRVVRVMRDPPYREADDVYYVESEPKRVIYEQPRRRTAVIRRPPATNEYVYLDESPSTVVRRQPHRSEVVYIDNDRPLDYEEEIVYVDDHDNEIEYIYDNEPIHYRRNHSQPRQPSLTNIVYE